MKMLEKNYQGPRYRIKVTDIDGEVTIFESAQELADVMQCTRQSIYNAINLNKKLRGCKIERA